MVKHYVLHAFIDKLFGFNCKRPKERVCPRKLGLILYFMFYKKRLPF